MEQVGFGGIIFPVCRLIHVKQAIVIQVLLKLLKNSFLQKFSKKRQIGNWMIICQAFLVKTCFVRRGMTSACLKRSGTQPDTGEKFRILVNISSNSSEHALSNEAGIQSSAQLLLGHRVKRPWMYLSDAGSNWERGVPAKTGLEQSSSATLSVKVSSSARMSETSLSKNSQNLSGSLELGRQDGSEESLLLPNSSSETWNGVFVDLHSVRQAQ